jgi:hypothetical protein
MLTWPVTKWVILQRLLRVFSLDTKHPQLCRSSCSLNCLFHQMGLWILCSKKFAVVSVVSCEVK